MVNLWFGAAWLLMGLIWLWRAYTGQKASAMNTLMARPEELLLHKRERTFALVIGILNLLLGAANLWVGLRHR